jgi:glycerophosphoryl diester phosphodiesterase
VTPLVIGHRGAMGYCPENTLLSFQRAVDLGADWVELDVHRSRDGVLVVIHDETLERTTNGTGWVADHTLAELQRLDAGQGQRIPTLDDVLDWARQHGVGVDIEVKNAPPEAVIDAVRRAGLLDKVLISSFDHPLVQRTGRLEPRLPVGLLYAHRAIDPVQMAHAAGASMLLPQWPYVVAEDVEAIHAAGLQVGTWATSDPAALAALVGMGVDAIATNHPDVLRQILANR